MGRSVTTRWSRAFAALGVAALALGVASPSPAVTAAWPRQVPGATSAEAPGETFSDDFESYPAGVPPSGYHIRGADPAVTSPTVVDTGTAWGKAVAFPYVGWQYWDQFLIKDGLQLEGPSTITVKMRYLTPVADRAGLAIGWNDATGDHIGIEPNIYGKQIEFRASPGLGTSYTVTGTASTGGGLQINANTDYWLRVTADTLPNGDDSISVFWSTNGATFTQVLQATGPSTDGAAIHGMIGVSHAGPNLPGVWFDDLTVDEVTSPSQEITFLELPDVIYGVGPITLTAAASSGLPVSYEATGACAVNGRILSVSGIGTCNVTASQAGDAVWAPAPSVMRIFVSRLARPNATGAVIAWGSSSYGLTSVPAGLTQAVAVASGSYHSLALRSDGTVAVWGDSSRGQTASPAGLDDVVAIAGGGSHSLALQSDGTVVAWGDNASGETAVPAGLHDVVAIAAGTSHSLALRADGTVVAWGSNARGQATVPANLAQVVAIAGGAQHSVAVRADGTVVGWGDNSAGQATPPEGLTRVIAIAAGSATTMAVKDDGSVVAWGSNGYGQLNVPQGLDHVVAASVGATDALVLRQNGTMVGWGSNYYGAASPPPSTTGAISMAVGGFHAVALVPFSLPVVPTPGAWTYVTNNVAFPRYSFRATALPDGRVLMEGGFAPGQYANEVELYDPQTNAWTVAESMQEGRGEHTATLLADGRVLIAGGYAGPVRASAETYDPATGHWLTTGSMRVNRTRHSAVRLADGRVLVAGGWNGRGISTAEIFNPSTGIWTLTGGLPAPLQDPISFLLRDGTVLLVGGSAGEPNPTATAAAYVYQPSMGTFVATTSMHHARVGFGGVVLADGRVLVIGGDGATGGSTAEIYEPATKVWTEVAPLAGQHALGGGADPLLLPDGRVVVPGGSGATSVEIYDSVTNSWSAGPVMNEPRTGAATALLEDGRVLAVSGRNQWTRTLTTTSEYLDLGSSGTVSVEAPAPADAALAAVGPGFALSRPGASITVTTTAESQALADLAAGTVQAAGLHRALTVPEKASFYGWQVGSDGTGPLYIAIRRFSLVPAGGALTDPALVAAQDLVNYLLSAPGQAALAAAGFTPLAAIPPVPIPDVDINVDGIVSLPDIGLLVGRWAQASACRGWIRADVNNDGIVSLPDIGLLVGRWGMVGFIPPW